MHENQVGRPRPSPRHQEASLPLADVRPSDPLTSRPVSRAMVELLQLADQVAAADSQDPIPPIRVAERPSEMSGEKSIE